MLPHLILSLFSLTSYIPFSPAIKLNIPQAVESMIDVEEHCYAMDITVGSSKRERGTDSDPPTPCKPQKGKKKKKKSTENEEH